MQSVVFVSPIEPGPPTEITLPDGGVVVRRKICVPGDSDDWTENSCDDAFEALASLPSQQYFPQLSYSICFIDLTYEEFFSWVGARGFDLPLFWKPSMAKASNCSLSPALNSRSQPRSVKSNLRRSEVCQRPKRIGFMRNTVVNTREYPTAMKKPLT